jgi:hypothetical protein
MHDAAGASVLVGIIGIVVALRWLPGPARSAFVPRPQSDGAVEKHPEAERDRVLVEA